MKRFYIVKDGVIQGSAATRENAIDMIRAYQEHETHYLLRAEYSLIEGTEETIGYTKISLL